MRAGNCSTILICFAVAGGCSASAPNGAPASMGSGGTTEGNAGSGMGGTESAGQGGAATSGAGLTSGASGAGTASTNGGSGGEVTGGAGGSSPIDAATPGRDASAADDTGVRPPPPDGGGDGGPQNFNCTLVIGCYQTSQWFDAGFETAVGNPRWEIKWEHNTFTEHWASPTDPFWNIPVTSACASGATTPDRVLFISYSMTLTTEAEWETQLTHVVDNVKTKFPSVKRIQLLGMARAPNDQMCPGNSDTAIVVRPEEDQAMQAVADQSSGLVDIGPKYFVPSCDSFLANNTNLTAAAASAVATSLSAFYK